MADIHFVAIERLVEGRSHFYVVHAIDPKFSVEIEPEILEDGKIGSGCIRRLVLPNSWCGGYHRPSKLLGEALDYLRRTLENKESTSGRFNL